MRKVAAERKIGRAAVDAAVDGGNGRKVRTFESVKQIFERPVQPIDDRIQRVSRTEGLASRSGDHEARDVSSACNLVKVTCQDRHVVRIDAVVLRRSAQSDGCHAVRDDEFRDAVGDLAFHVHCVRSIVAAPGCARCVRAANASLAISAAWYNVALRSFSPAVKTWSKPSHALAENPAHIALERRNSPKPHKCHYVSKTMP